MTINNFGWSSRKPETNVPEVILFFFSLFRYTLYAPFHVIYWLSFAFFFFSFSNCHLVSFSQIQPHEGIITNCVTKQIISYLRRVVFWYRPIKNRFSVAINIFLLAGPVYSCHFSRPDRFAIVLFCIVLSPDQSVRWLSLDEIFVWLLKASKWFPVCVRSRASLCKFVAILLIYFVIWLLDVFCFFFSSL